jgi:glutamine amidotransferase
MHARVGIVDYGMGNLFSVKHACEHVGLEAVVTQAKVELFDVDAIILPGVGAFGTAMATLAGLGLVDLLQFVAQSGRLFIGICLGMQLLMRRSYEFGVHEGLGLIAGEVRRFDHPQEGTRPLKVPMVGWQRIFRPDGRSGLDAWSGSPLRDVPNGAFMYFVHSYCVHPQDPSVVLARTRYGSVEYCAALQRGNIIGFQFHPERSGPEGLKIYRAIADLIRQVAS